jgi:endoglucanase
VNQQEVAIKEVITDTDHRQLLILKLNQEILTDDVITISTLSNDCKSGSTVLKAFANNQVSNKMATHFTLPAKVEAEDYAVNNGFEFEDTEDVGGGQNAGYAATGKYLDYIIYTEKAVSCNIDLRVAVNKASARIAMYDIGETNQLINAVTLSNTGGWQKWQTQQSTAHFKRGKNIFRIQAITDGFNLNWFEFSNLQETGVASSRLSNHPVKVYPNPVKDYLYIVLNQPADVCLSLNDLTGRVQYANNYSNLEKIKIDVSSFYNGIYVLQLNLSDHSFSEKIIVDRT